jgi:hypothetical protein
MEDKAKDEESSKEQNGLEQKLDDMYKQFVPRLTLRRIAVIIMLLIATGCILFYAPLHIR